MATSPPWVGIAKSMQKGKLQIPKKRHRGMVMVQSEQFKKGPWLLREFVGDEMLPSYMRIMS